MRYPSNRENIVRTATIAATNITASSAFELIERDAEGGGNVNLAGSYTGADDAVVDVEIMSNTINGTPQISAPIYSGVGNGTISGIGATSGIDAQEFEVIVSDLGTPTRAAFAPFQAGNLIARTTGPDGNEYTVEISQAELVATATDYSVTRELAAGASEFSGAEYNFGAVSIEPEGTVPADAPRIRFGDDVTVYRHWRQFRAGQYRYLFSPAIQRNVPIGTLVYAITGGRTVRTYDGATEIDEFTGVTSLYSLVSAIKASSTIIDYDGIIAEDRRPGGMACDDLGVYTASYSAGSVREGSSYVKKAAIALTVPEDAPSESFAITCIAAPVPGEEIWSVSGSVSGELTNATTGIAYTDTYAFTIPVQLQAGGEPPGTKSAEFELLPRSASETVPSLCVRNFRLGSEASSKTFTFEWRPRPAASCDCTSVTVSGGPIDIFLGGPPDDDVVGALPVAVKSLYSDVQTWRVGALAQNCFFTATDDATYDPEPFSGGVFVVTDVTDVSNPTYADPLPDYEPGSFTSILQSCSVVARFEEQDIRAITMVGNIFQTHLLLIYDLKGGTGALDSAIEIEFQDQFDAIVDLLLPLSVLTNTGASEWKRQIAYIQQTLDDPGDAQTFEERALEYTAASVAGSRNLTRDLESLLRLCEARLSSVYIAADLIPPFGDDGTIGNAVWMDQGGTHWFVSLDGLLPIQPGFYYHSAVMVEDANGIQTPTPTREFGIGPAIGCPESLKVGDKLIITLNPFANGRATYQPGDSITYQIVRADPVQLGGGQTGDDTITFTVRGSVVGALIDYELVTTAPTSYSDGGLSFTITPGAIAFAPGDSWTFAAEGGEFRWRFDGGSWTTADIASTVSLTSGVSAQFVTGENPSFVDGDTYQIKALASNGAGRARYPDDESMSWTGSTQIDLTVVGSGAADTLMLGAHTIASTATITLIGSNDNFATNAFSQTLTWADNNIALLFTSTTCAKWRLTVNQSGSIGWLYLGVPARPLVFDSTLPENGTWARRIRSANASRARGIAGTIRHEQCSYASAISVLDSIEYAHSNDDGRIGAISAASEAGIYQAPNEFELDDAFGHQPDASGRIVSFALEMQPI